MQIGNDLNSSSAFWPRAVPAAMPVMSGIPTNHEDHLLVERHEPILSP